MVGQPANTYAPAQVFYPGQFNNLQQFQRPVPMQTFQASPTVVGMPANANYTYPLCANNAPTQSQIQQAKASTSAVTINIYDPKAVGGPEQQPAPPPPQMGYFAIPNASIYENSGFTYPQQTIVPNNFAQPGVVVPQTIMPTVVPQPSVDYSMGQYPIVPQNQSLQTPQPIIYQQPPGVPQPGVNPQMMENMVPPTSTMQVQPQPVNQPYPAPPVDQSQVPVNPEPSTQAPQADATQATPQQPQQPEQPELTVNDLPAINAALVQGDEKVKSTAIEAIARIGQGDKDTYNNLINILSRNPGSAPADQQSLAKENKLHAMYTLAILNKNQNPQVPFAQLPGIDNIVDVIKKEKDPEMRKKAIAVLDFMARKEDIAVLSRLYNLALKKEKNDVVKEALKRGLYNLQQLSKDK